MKRRLLIAFGLLLGLDGLVEGAVSTRRHTDFDHLSIDVDFVLLEIDIPATAGSPQGVAARIAADRAFSGDGAYS